MGYTAVAQLLPTFSKTEARTFKKWLQSPFFNQREDLQHLFAWLWHEQQRQQPFPTKPMIFEKLYPTQAFSDQQVRLVLSWLLQQMEAFLCYQATQQQPLGQERALTQVYWERGLQKIAAQTLRSAQQQLAQHPHRNAEFFYEEYLLSREAYKQLQQTARTTDLPLQVINDRLDVFYLLSKLKQSCLMLSHKAVYKTPYRHNFLPELLHALSQSDLLARQPAVQVYYYCYQALEQEQEPYFRAFYEALRTHGALFTTDELKDLYLLAINFCIKKLNDGSLPFAQHGLQLYKEALAQQLLLEGGHISRFAYRNIVAMGLVLEDFVYVAHFIEAYASYLEEAHRDSIYSFCKARLAYSQHRYDAAIQLLQKADYKDVLLHLAAKTMLLKIYFEREENDLLSAHLQTMQTFIRRKRLMGYHQQNYVNMIKFTKRLTQLNPYDKAALTLFATEVQHTDVLTEREWFLTQIAALQQY